MATPEASHAFLPAEAVWARIEGHEGWCYAIYGPYGQRFCFFLWRDGDDFQVTLVDPPLEGADPPLPHLGPDGRLELPQHRARTVLAAFQASIVWVASLSLALRLPTS